MQKKEIQAELDQTKKEVKSLKRELNKLREKWAFIDKIGKSLLCVAFVFVTMKAAEYTVPRAIVFLVGRSNIEKAETLWETVATLVVYLAVIAVIFYIPKLINKKFKTTKKEAGVDGLPTFTDIGIGIIGYVITFASALIIFSIINSLHIIDLSGSQDIEINALTGFDRALTYIQIAVLPPIFEEIIFRGWLYGKLRKNLPIAPSIILVSLLFGIFHPPVSAGIYVTILSAFMCLEREITGTIHAGILTHMIQNSVGLAFRLIRM